MTGSPTTDPSAPSRGAAAVRVLAAATAVATLVLVVAGALVTSHDAGLAVPDWPTTYGYNMFTYPLSGMQGGVFYEHGHRLMGSLVGLLTVALGVAALVAEKRRSVRRMAVAAVVLVVVQGVLGGLRVTRLDLDLAIVHGCVAQGFFALVVALFLVTRRAFRALPSRPLAADASRLRAHSLLVAVLVYAQVVAGALLRHRGARLDAHVGLALVVAIAAFSLAWRSALPRSADATAPRALRVAAAGVAALVLTQLFLGLGSFATTFAGAGVESGSALEIGFTVAHVAGGALLLATSVATSILAFRLVAGPDRAAAAASEGRLEAAGTAA